MSDLHTPVSLFTENSEVVSMIVDGLEVEIRSSHRSHNGFNNVAGDTTATRNDSSEEETKRSRAAAGQADTDNKEKPVLDGTVEDVSINKDGSERHISPSKDFYGDDIFEEENSSHSGSPLLQGENVVKNDDVSSSSTAGQAVTQPPGSVAEDTTMAADGSVNSVAHQEPTQNNIPDNSGNSSISTSWLNTIKAARAATNFADRQVDTQTPFDSAAGDATMIQNNGVDDSTNLSHEFGEGSSSEQTAFQSRFTSHSTSTNDGDDEGLYSNMDYKYKVADTSTSPPEEGSGTQGTDAGPVVSHVAANGLSDDNTPPHVLPSALFHKASVNLDLSTSIKGMYRVLDLITEQGSGGLVDKIIIAQDSLQAFVNTISPGAYVSLTKVDFKTLDKFIVKPIGVYGSKEEVIRFLSSVEAIDDAVAQKLLAKEDVSKPTLRSGLYIVRCIDGTTAAEQIYVVYWPEDTTWDDSAASSVRRNRVTFLRYLTKMCDQVMALISPQHAERIVWGKEKHEDFSMDIDQDDSDRLFSFEVAQTNEQEESVKVRPGFQMISSSIKAAEQPVDSPLNPSSFKPWLINGETVQGFMTSSYQSVMRTIKPLQDYPFSKVDVEAIMRDNVLIIDEKLDAESLDLLIKLSLNRYFPEECKLWSQRKHETRQASAKDVKEACLQIGEKLQLGSTRLGRILHEAIVEGIIGIFPTMSRDRLELVLDKNEQVDDQPSESLSGVSSFYPKVGELVATALQDPTLSSITSTAYKTQKGRLFIIDILLSNHCKGWDEARLLELIDLVIKGPDTGRIGQALAGASSRGFFTHVLSLFSLGDSHEMLAININKEAREATVATPDPLFLSSLDDLLAHHPLLRDTVSNVRELAYSEIEKTVARLDNSLKHQALSVQVADCTRQYKREAAGREGEEQRKLRSEFIRRINKLSQSGAQSGKPQTHTLLVTSIQEHQPTHSYSTRYSWGTSTNSYTITGKREILQEPYLSYTFHVLDLTSHDRHNLQLDPSFIPSPCARFSHSFRLPIGFSIEHVQLLENERILLIVSDRARNLQIYLEKFSAIDGAVGRERGKTLHRDKIGHEFVLAFDEAKGLLAVCVSDKLQLHMFQYEESRGSFQALGSAVNLLPWYSNDVSICHACFVSGNEELLLLDSLAQARIYSLITMQFRPASLTLHQIPTAIYSSPDGSCLLVAQAQGLSPSITAYHWSSFGSNEGIPLDITNLILDNKLVLTSFGGRSAVHLLVLDETSHSCRSYALNITKKVTEFMFKERGSRTPSQETVDNTAHNCLIDCHAEVWTRFPVLPAVQRETISNLSERCSKTLVFVADRDHERFSPHFSDMIHTFERTTRKPTGDQLKTIAVSAMLSSTFFDELSQGLGWDVSRLRAGEWLVDFLCLIPIHLAITKENRFVPLKDGVSSVELEKSLLGAEVGRIVDSLSFGWYESIFASYMASKPVKVVSSMGEQSVGKSFALNHLVDTSFAGSAMRTTEGVWMSVTPTEDALIVALDFEGVHSIERSAQEDTLLVLFNTAISNLVLFRNNFALSRDITGLFQSFQSSSTVLDPAANPTLFQSTLVIIIKDVVDSDKSEIAREFSLKFQKIVQQEQGANFISRLHAGKLNIIPWPVIESKEFYKLFPTVKKSLGRQTVTHNTAGEFLHTMKTLMAKLKANDWGALSQTMAAHRAQVLLTLLPNALAFGFAEVEPECEPLKNMDSDMLIEGPDTTSQFSLATAGGQQAPAREKTLSALRIAWDQHQSRQLISDAVWAEALSEHLEHLVDMRINRVREWIASNLVRFQTGHANIEELRRTLESATVDLKANIQLCKMQCTSCHLLCVQSRIHDGNHDCRTNHQCAHLCEFCNEAHAEQKTCSMSAGHPGKHICIVNAHLCGESCKLKGKQGCLGECTRVIGHAEKDHLCAASVHACGEPCSLSDIKLADGARYSCKGSCGIPSDRDHVQHVCDARLCPVSCQLCKRLCSDNNHLHGLEPGAIHLCGQEHSCTSLCSAAGICEIDTAPYSIEATFTGRHETFQYTKYSQVAKRLRCIKAIPAGVTEHTGQHCHSLDKAVIHFCEIRCENCGYFCTLPLGHPQQEHETRHGSMSQARWAVEGPDDTSLELEGRKFSSNDDGAPMMCNLICQTMGRHVHIDYCRGDTTTPCGGNTEIQHIPTRMIPHPDRPKDAITHSLHWRRSGFKDPYSRDDQTNFAKCDAMCGGPEHSATAGGASQPSHCTLAMFHPPADPNNAPAGLGYVSSDGHIFSCRNPVVMQQAFHVIFVIDRSGSMGATDRRPLANAPSSNRITQRANNRLGAVYSSLHSFWSAREAAVTRGQQIAARRDSYSVILFDHTMTVGVVNDFTSSPDQLLNTVLQYGANGSTDYTAAIRQAQAVIEQNWSTERTPVVIFLSDGECSITDATVQDLCRSAVRLGKPLSFHAVSFGPDSRSASLRRMAQIALEVQNNAPRDPLAPAAATVLSTYAQALDSVQLAETFLGIAESLRKPRGSLLR